MSDALIVGVLGALAGMLGPVILFLVQHKKKSKDLSEINTEAIKENTNLIKQYKEEQIANWSEFGKTLSLIDEKMDSLGGGVMMLLRKSLREEHHKHMSRGQISSRRLRDFEETYDIYHTLGGNSIATRWKNDLEALPLDDESDM